MRGIVAVTDTWLIREVTMLISGPCQAPKLNHNSLESQFFLTLSSSPHASTETSPTNPSCPCEEMKLPHKQLLSLFMPPDLSLVLLSWGLCWLCCSRAKQARNYNHRLSTHHSGRSNHAEPKGTTTHKAWLSQEPWAEQAAAQSKQHPKMLCPSMKDAPPGQCVASVISCSDTSLA